MEVVVIVPDWLWLVALFALVAFGGICGSALLWCLHVRPVEARVRQLEKQVAVDGRAFCAQFKVHRERTEALDERLQYMAREMPTVPPPAR